MNLSVTWLNNILSFNIPIYKTKQLQKLLTFYGFNPNSLTLNGFEVESIYNKEIQNKNDIIVEIDTTPNRRDLASIAGICQELSILLNIKTIQKTFYPNNTILSYGTKLISNKIQTQNSPYQMLYVQAHNIKVNQSPKWLRKRLQTYDIEPIDIFSDITNYMQIEWGQTIIFYDLDKIQNFKLKLEQKNKENTFKTNYEKILNIANSQVISNNNQILSICGIEINNTIKVDNKTTAVLIECANYSRKEIKQNFHNTKLRTSVSTFNEKGVTKDTMNLALQRTLKLLSLSCEDIRFKKGPFYLQEKKDKKTIRLNYNEIRQVLGKSNKNKELTDIEINLCIQRLKFPRINTSELNQIELQIPQFRTFDIEEKIDIIEEIGRMYGFNYFKSNLPKIKNIGKFTQEQKLINKFQTFSINNGFYELINYSFLQIPETDKLMQNSYRIINPISTGNTLQQSLINNLVKTIDYNTKQQNKLKRGFEIARIFHKNANKEITFFSGFITDETYRTEWSTIAKDYSWYQFKELITNLLTDLNLTKINWIPNQSTNQLHSSRNAILKYGSITLGSAGQINPIYAKNKNISSNTYLFELNATLISQLIKPQTITYKDFCLFPSISRDISFTIYATDVNAKYDLMFKKFINNSDNFVQKLYLKDNYEFEKNNIKYRTLTYSFIFQSKFRTLKNDEIDQWIVKINNEIEKINEFKKILKVNE